ncbi:MAG: hypothetical protein NT062_24620 [Proteobacteria bacterium]|nr:hypothetical protein [Pseudomonadota bacterium]
MQSILHERAPRSAWLASAGLLALTLTTIVLARATPAVGRAHATLTQSKCVEGQRIRVVDDTTDRVITVQLRRAPFVGDVHVTYDAVGNRQ